MLTITSTHLSEHSSAQSAVAVIRTNWTGKLPIIIVLSSLAIAGKRFATLYVNVDFEEGNVEQAVQLKASPLNCKQSLLGLLASPGFVTTVVLPVVVKVQEEQRKANNAS